MLMDKLRCIGGWFQRRIDAHAEVESTLIPDMPLFWFWVFASAFVAIALLPLALVAAIESAIREWGEDGD